MVKVVKGHEMRNVIDTGSYKLTHDSKSLYVLCQEVIRSIREKEWANLEVLLERFRKVPTRNTNVGWWLPRIIESLEKAVVYVSAGKFKLARGWARTWTVGYIHEYRQIRNFGRPIPPVNKRLLTVVVPDDSDETEVKQYLDITWEEAL